METKQLIKEILTKHNLLHLATVGLDGTPQVRGLDYTMGEDESVLYFITNKNSNKVKEIENNPQIAIVIDYDCKSMEELAQLKYIKATGKATILRSPEEVQRTFGLILQKFPYLKDLPGEPTDFVGVKLDLNKVLVINNAKGFNHIEEVTF